MKIQNPFNFFPHPWVINSSKQKSRYQKYKSFNLFFLIALSIPVLSVGLFNFLIDPYGIYKSPDFGNINHEKPKKDDNDRLYKAIDVIRFKPITIFLGSSRTKQGLDPNHPALANVESVYNLALNGPNIYEQLQYLKHIIENQKNLRKVIFGIDFFMFNANLKNQPTFSQDRLGKSYIIPQDLINTLFSFDALSASQETIMSSLKNTNSDDNYGNNGFFPNRNINDGNTKWRFKQAINLYFRLHSDYQFSPQYLADFQKIVDLCRQKGITLKVFISPAHATDLEAIRATGHWQTFEQWKRDIVKITPVWNFSGYNSITTEPIKERMKNYADNSHYSVNIGNLVLNRIFAYDDEKVPKDFGIWLTSENVEAEIAKMRADRELWAKDNPQEVQFVKDIKRSFDTLKQKKQEKHPNPTNEIE